MPFQLEYKMISHCSSRRNNAPRIPKSTRLRFSSILLVYVGFYCCILSCLYMKQVKNAPALFRKPLLRSFIDCTTTYCGRDKLYRDPKSNLNSLAAKDVLDSENGNKIIHYSTKSSLLSDSIHPKVSSISNVTLMKQTSLPDWAIEYLIWHKQALEELNSDHQNVWNYKYLISRCLKIDVVCGGASDRLQSIPFMLRIASKHRRLLFIEWERPARLDEFLVPPEGGLDWRLPEWFRVKIRNQEALDDNDDEKRLFFGRVPLIHANQHLFRLELYPNRTLADMKYQTKDHGKSFYNEQRVLGKEPSFDEIYMHVWKVFFKPSDPVQALIDQYSDYLCLSSGNAPQTIDSSSKCLQKNDYVSLHIRSLYYKDKTQQHDQIANAVNCALHLAQNISISSSHQSKIFPSIYVASDSSNVTKQAIEYGMHSSNRIVVVGRTVNDSSTPLHLDRGSNFLMNHKSNTTSNWMDYLPSAYYDVFVDLYLLTGGKCVTYNVGGFGYWASLISGHPTCGMNHQLQQCKSIANGERLL